jgi:calcineurin-like phosphoesterase family protein
MSIVRFIADLHLGHENMAKKRGFSSAAEHDEHIIKMWNSVVAKRDLTYILGDVTMETSKYYPLLDRLNGRKKVVLGNHDMPKDVPELLKYVDQVGAMMRYKGIWMSHCPVHPMELEHRVRRIIHGHIHENYVMKQVTFLGFNLFQRVDRRYHCVSCEHVNYTPVTLDQLGIKR